MKIKARFVKAQPPCPGGKIRSGGKGRGSGRGQGKGPLGVPSGPEATALGPVWGPRRSAMPRIMAMPPDKRNVHLARFAMTFGASAMVRSIVGDKNFGPWRGFVDDFYKAINKSQVEQAVGALVETMKKEGVFEE